MSDPDTLEKPSEFWSELAQQHSNDLRSFGFGEVKRRQALRYFNWQWRLGRLRRSEQLRFLLKHTSSRQWLASIREPMKLSAADWRGVEWSRTERWIYTAMVRLLWMYASQHDPAGVTRMEEPALGGPLPVYWHGRLISQDLANSALETAAIRRALQGRDAPRFALEVGAGYGRLAHVLLKLFPAMTYSICDIEPALSISRWYLGQLFSPDRLRFLSPAEATQLAPASIDLAISISSLQEMTSAQIADYLSLIDRAADGGTVYLKQWREWRNPVDQITARFADYPIPGTWTKLFEEPAPVQTNFQQAAWSIPTSIL